MKLSDLMLHESAGVDKDQQRKEISRVGDYWHKHGKGMSKDELIDAISNDFEQLEYSPEEVEKMTDAVLRILRVPGA